MSWKILIVEDNEKNRILLRDLLKHFGYEVVEAVNGAEGIELAKEHLPALIMMDIQMPVMDGFTALKTIRNTAGIGDIKVIALTSFAMSGDRENILDAGFDDYIAKPVDTRKLPEIIRRHLGKTDTRHDEETAANGG